MPKARCAIMAKNTMITIYRKAISWITFSRACRGGRKSSSIINSLWQKMKISSAHFINAVFILLLVSCKNPAGEHAISHKSPRAAGINSAFFEKVLAQDTLSYGLLSKYVRIDRASLDEKVIFTGDTIYFQDSARPILVIDALTPVCTYKYIFLYDDKRPKNKEAILAEIACDEDFDADYTRLKYKIINDSTI